MESEIKIQQEDIRKLLKLAKENPELKIIPMVDSEVIESDDYNCWAGEWSCAEIDECYCDDERIYFKSTDYEELVDEYIDNLTEDSNEVVEEHAKKIVDKLPWEKVIAVHIRAL